MFKKFRVMTVVALAAFAVTVTVGALTAADDKVPSVKEIMTQGHKGTESLIAKVKGAVKGQKWDDAKVPADALKVFGEALGKNKPTKGDAESWKKLTDKYMANTAAVVAGVEKKDAKAVTAALGGIKCAECHDAHKGK